MIGRLLCFSLAALVILACDRGQQPEADLDPAGRRECPHDWPDRVEGGELTLAGPRINVPEFHDCQRFIVQNAQGQLVYTDEFYAIFAAFELEALEDSLDLLEDQFGFARMSLAAAEIYTPGQYDPLGILPPISCLFVWRTQVQTVPDSVEWRAKMVRRQNVPGNDCRQALDPSELTGKDLEVRRTIAEGFTEPKDYPAAARWDWDMDNLEQYVGVRCGAAWCEVGDPGFQRSPTYLEQLPNPGALPEGLRRIYSIKGWYDEQLLAAVKNTGDPPEPTRILGRVFPDSQLTEYTMGDFMTGAQVAQVALNVPTGVQNPYEAKFGFQATTPGQPLNTIRLCHGAKSNCLPTAALATVPNCGNGQWWARAAGNVGVPKHLCVVRYAMPNVDVPGTARWRWLATDEGDWFRCVDGCCEMTIPGG